VLFRSVEAARDALADRDRAVIEGVTLSSTTHPFADRSNAGIVKEALVLADAVGALDSTGSQRAATSALIQALDGTQTRLCVAAERRSARAASEAEMVQGDAGAALLVGAGDVVARFLGAHSVTIDFVDHFRMTGESYDYAWERRWVRDEGYVKILGGALNDALAKLGVKPEAVDRALIAAPVRGIPESLAKRCGIRAEAVADSMAASVGDAGAAHPLLMLAAALEVAEPGETVLVASFGQGADVLLFETTEAITRVRPRLGVSGHLKRRVEDDNYMRFLFHRGVLDVERGMRAEHDEKQPGTALFRRRTAVMGLVGGRDAATGAVQFPKSEIALDGDREARGALEDYPLADVPAKIMTYTADTLAYSMDPPSYYGMIDFEGGGRMMAEFADVDSDALEVGLPLRMIFRVKARDEQRGFVKYFWKAAPESQGDT